MTVVNRLNLLILLFVTLAALLLVLLLGEKTYQLNLERQVDRAGEQVAQRADLQWSLYREDKSALTQALEKLTSLNAVTAVVAYSRTGDTLATVGGEGGPTFPTLRSTTSSIEPVLRVVNDRGEATGTGFLAWLRSSGDTAYLSLPVISTVNPDQSQLDSHVFIDALARPDNSASDFVLGYIHLTFDLGTLSAGLLPRIVTLLIPWLLCIVAGAIVLLWWNRRNQRRLDKLVAAMDRVAQGHFTDTVTLKGGQEFTDISNALNRLAQSLQQYNKEIELGRELLNRKVEERTSQLSRSHEELNRATEAASESAQRLQQLTYYDPLTSLPNRRLLTEQFNLLIRLSRRAGQSLALLYLEIDNLRHVNDTQGQHAGDLLLREVAKRLQHCTRDSDVVTRMGDTEHNIAVSRLGGDQFSVILNQLDTSQAAAIVARRIIRSLAEPMNIDGHEIVARATVGIAVYPDDGDNAGTLLDAAGTAMRAARKGSDREGGEGYLYFHRDMIESDASRHQLESQLRAAVEQEALLLHYLPQIDTVMGSVVAIEALPYWEHPERGLLAPGEFLPVALEDTTLMRRIADRALTTACRHLKSLDGKAAELPRLILNVAIPQLCPDFPERIKSALRDAGLEPGQLVLKLPEHLPASSDQSAVAALRELRANGVCLALDGYGLGQTSLAQVSQFPLNVLQVAPAFLADFRQHRQTGPVKALLGTAKSLGLQSAAAGVETREEYQLLAEEGVRLMQGKLFSGPLPPDELTAVLAPWHFIEHIRAFGVEAS